MAEPAPEDAPRDLFVTGRLAEFSLRQVVDEAGRRSGRSAEIAVLPISVAALMTPRWVARHLDVPPGVGRVVLPGHCRGDLAPIADKAGPEVEVIVGPEDLRDLPRFLGGGEADRRTGYGSHAIEILAEINHAPRIGLDAILAQADGFLADGADRIDLGCDPDGPWPGVGDAVKALLDRGTKVSIDSFDRVEVADAVAAGADLVLSVDATNVEAAVDWGVEVVLIPDMIGTLDGLDATADRLTRAGVPFRLDPIIEPIGFGFAASLGRYLEARRRFPDTPMLMGIGNLTELTEVDSAGVNLLLIGFCEELSIGSVLTTAVAHWARSSVRESDLARKLAHHAVARRTLPKGVDPALVALRDARPHRFGPDALAELARSIRDPNWRIFAEDGQIHAINNAAHLADRDPFVLFDRMGVDDPSHAFYLGVELMKAKTALTLGKDYRQDQALGWGFLTEPEPSHRARRRETSP